MPEPGIASNWCSGADVYLYESVSLSQVQLKTENFIILHQNDAFGLSLSSKQFLEFWEFLSNIFFSPIPKCSFHMLWMPMREWDISFFNSPNGMLTLNSTLSSTERCLHKSFKSWTRRSSSLFRQPPIKMRRTWNRNLHLYAIKWNM